MQTLLRVEDTDSGLEFGPDWAWAVQGNYHYSDTIFSRFYIVFRGTGIKIYGQYGDKGATLLVSTDGGNDVSVSLNGTSDGTQQIWNITGLEDTDHQIHGLTNPNPENGGNRIWIDYVELENTAGTGFNPRNSGTNATNVPQEAVIVEDTDSSIQYSPQYQWSVNHNIQYHGPNLSGTKQNGTSLTFTFEGVAVWYYSDVGSTHAALTASIDGSPPEWASGYTSRPGGLTRQLIWSKTSLPPGRHTLTLAHAGEQGQYLTIDYFRVLRNEDSGVTSTTGITSPDASSEANISQGNLDQTRLGVAIGVPLLLGVILLVSFTIYVRIRLHRRRRQTGLVQRFHTPHMSQQLQTRRGTFKSRAATAPFTDPTLPPRPSTTLNSQSQLSPPHLDWGSSFLSSVEAPPPYQSP